MDTLTQKDEILYPRAGIFKRVRDLHADWENLPRLAFGNLMLDTETRRILVKGGLQSSDDQQQTIPLSPSETEVLRLLLLVTDINSNQGGVASVNEIQEWLDYRLRLQRRVEDPLLESTDVERIMILRLRRKMVGLRGLNVSLEHNTKGRYQLTLIHNSGNAN